LCERTNGIGAALKGNALSWAPAWVESGAKASTFQKMIRNNKLLALFNRRNIRKMTFSDIEAALETLSPEELRRLALKSWTKFVERENGHEAGNECSEDDPALLAALDEAVQLADAQRERAIPESALRGRLSQWIST